MSHGTAQRSVADIKTYFADQQGNSLSYTGIDVTGSSYDFVHGTQLDIQTLEYHYSYVIHTLTLTAFQPRFVTIRVDQATSLDIIRPPAGAQHASVYVSGHNDDNPTNTQQMLALGYPATGGTWAHYYYYPAPTNAQAASTKVVVGQPYGADIADIRVYFAGQTSTGAEVHPVVQAYFPSSGSLWWEYTPADPHQVAGDEAVFDIATNDAGDVYLTGTHFFGGSYNYRTIKLFTDITIPPPPLGNRFAWGIEYDSSGTDTAAAIRTRVVQADASLADVYITGFATGPGIPTLPERYTTVRYIQTRP